MSLDSRLFLVVLSKNFWETINLGLYENVWPPLVITILLSLISIELLPQDSPEKGVLYLLRLLLEKIKEYEFDPLQGGQATVYLNILDVLCWCAQDSYPYHLQNVVSNDQLYGADPKFINEINEIATEIVEDLLLLMKSFSDRVKLQSSIALELFQRVSTKADLCDDKIFQLALNLWNLTLKNRHVMEPKAHVKLLSHLESSKILRKNQNSRTDELINRIKSKLWDCDQVNKSIFFIPICIYTKCLRFLV